MPGSFHIAVLTPMCDLCRPVSKSLSAIDALYTTGELLQITTAKSHSVKAAGIHAAWSALKGRSQPPSSYALWFVVPKPLFQGFQMQKIEGSGPAAEVASSLKQYAVTLHFEE